MSQVLVKWVAPLNMHIAPMDGLGEVPVVPLAALREWLKEKADHYRDLSTISAQQRNEMLRESQFDKASMLYTILASLGDHGA